MTAVSHPVELPRARDGQFRLALSSRAPAFLRMHLNRTVARVATLAIGDVVTLAALWIMLGEMVSGRFAPQPPIPLGQFIVAVTLALALFGCYGPGDQRRTPGAIARATALGAGLALWSNLWNSPLGAALPSLLAVWLLATVALVLVRRLIDTAVRFVQPTPAHVARALVIGTADEAVEVIDHPAIGEKPWSHLVGYFDPRQQDDRGCSAALAKEIRTRRVDTIIIAGQLDHAAYATVLDAAITSACRILSFPRVAPTPSLAPRIIWRDGAPIVEHTRPGAVGVERSVKRLIDVVIAAVTLLALSPVLVAVALLIRIQSDGPVLFRQVRIGRGGKRFRILKFRTMKPDSEGQRDALQGDSLYADARLFKLRSDPRVTPIGSVLRRTSLDELPQLWNVLVGDMSLVGPRPPLPSEVALYQDTDYARFDVKPGITGPWQVSGRNDICDFEEIVRLETAYIRRWSVWLDLGLLLRTVPAVLSGRGAH